MPAGIVLIADQARIAAGANTTTRPVLVGRFNGDGSERMGPGRQVILTINRRRDGTSGALEGTIAIWGVNLPHPVGANANVQVFRGLDGTTGKTVFTSALAHVAFGNFNWLVIQNGNVLNQGAGAGNYQISNAGGFGVVTLGTAAADNDVIEVYFVVPVVIRADGANEVLREQVIGRQVTWMVSTVVSTNCSGSYVTITPAGE